MSDQPKPDRTRVTLWLPSQLVEEAKVHAIRNQTSLSRMVADLLRQRLRPQESGEDLPS